MPIFKQKLSKKTKLQLTAVTAVIIAVGGYVAWDLICGGPLKSFFSNTEVLRAWVEKQGIFGPLALIFLQFVQTVIAPIPGNVVGVLGGYLFGLWGILWSIVGSGIGFLAVFALSRHFGRPLVEKIVKKDTLKKFDALFSKRGPFILFMIFLIPGLPDDVVCYIAGLTEIPIKNLMAMVVIGRLPAVVANNLIGSGLGEGNYTAVIIFTVVVAIMLAVIYTQQDRIFQLLGLTEKQEKRIEKQEKQIEKLEYDVEDLEDDGKLNQSVEKTTPKAASGQPSSKVAKTSKS